MSHEIKLKVWFCRLSLIFLNFLELNSFLALQICTKLQKIVNSNNIDILPCKLDLFVTWKKCDFVDIFVFFELNSFLALQICTKHQKIICSINIYILPCKPMCYVESNNMCDFVLLFEFSSTFWNLIHIFPRIFSLNFRKLLILSIFIFCLVNWTYMSNLIKQKVWFWPSFWIFL